MPVLIWDLDSTIFDTHLQLSTHVGYDESHTEIYDIRPFSDAEAALHMHGVVHIMLSYAKHSPELQYKKMDILGIRDFFEEIHVISKLQGKLETMSDIMCRYNGPFYVIGDRFDDEIEAGNKLGMTTILCLRGKHMLATPSNKYEKPDYSVKNLTKLSSIIRGNG